MPEEAKTEMKAEAGLFPEANFTKDKVELKGIETINGEDAYALKQGSTTYYYSVKSGLILGELKLQKANGQEMSIPTYYSDYKEVQGLKLPFKITQNINGMEMIFNVNSYEINKATEATFK